MSVQVCRQCAHIHRVTKGHVGGPEVTYDERCWCGCVASGSVYDGVPAEFNPRKVCELHGLSGRCRATEPPRPVFPMRPHRWRFWR